MTDDMILYALPVFGVLMLAELLWGLARGRNADGTRCEPTSAKAEHAWDDTAQTSSSCAKRSGVAGSPLGQTPASVDATARRMTRLRGA
jgi:hypothetical protein